ncbi:hypothetical protein KIW84_053253 [Lathyrus oleraceus]|uniref:Uncharacterized protein n=1 Tax=Pisum sativum TaxID=3888 RepID=A0A9D5AD37_PEA|nr:hypothetical protein KIW84_053253 [Pisum sativum]
MINFKCWSGVKSNAPIFVYLDAEVAIDESFNSIGFMIHNASTFKALLVFIESRYYGRSVPFGSEEEAFKNASTLDYFNSAQALTDYVEVIIHIQKTLHAKNSSVVAIGGSSGEKVAIDESPNSIGFMIHNASTFKALLEFIEHRYYGRSVPFGSKEEAFKNASTLD